MTLANLPHLERAFSFAELCQLAYNPPAEEGTHHGLQLEPFRYQTSLDGALLGLSGFVASTAEDVVLVFCGSKMFSEEPITGLANWIINLAATQVAEYGGRVHRGFAVAIAKIWDDVFRRVTARRTRPEQNLWLTGHSLGGALATLAACRFAKAQHAVTMVYTFGSPRVGDRTFADHYVLPHFRFEYRNDLVAFLCPPPDDLAPWVQTLLLPLLEEKFHLTLDESLFNYRHVGQCQFLDWDGRLRNEAPDIIAERLPHFREALTDHQIGNYMAALGELKG